MAMVVLRPQDCLKDRFRESTMTCSSDSAKSGRNRPRSGRRRRSPTKSGGNSDGNQVRTTKSPSAELVMEKVYILKRGEALTKMECKKGNDDLLVFSTASIAPDPDLVPFQIRLRDLRISGSSDEVTSPYAGTAFESSPSPRSLPLPAFFKKRAPRSEDLATKDLRRMLQLDF